jgi:prolyl oligopeptidase
MRKLIILLTIEAILIGAAAIPLAAIDYPESKPGTIVDTLHGVAVPDPYRWLEDTDDPAVQEWTDKQNALTRELLDSIPEREEVKNRLAELWNYTRVSPPSKYGDRYFFTKNEGLQDHFVLYYRDGLDGAPNVLIDPNTWPGDKTKAMNWWHVSPDGALIAYGVSEAGSENATLHLRQVGTQEDLPLQIERCRYSSIVWEEDNSGFFYTRMPYEGEVPPGDEHYFRRVCYHRMGDDPANDKIIWQNPEVREHSPGIWRSEDFNYMILGVWRGSTEENDLYYMDLTKRDGFQPIVTGFESTNLAVMIDTIVYIMTTDGAPNRRVMWANISNPERENWSELIPESEDLLQSVQIINRHLILEYLHDAHSVIKIHTLGGRLVKTVDLPTMGTVSGLTGEWDEPEMYFQFQSFVYPRTNFSYDFETGNLMTLERVELDVNPEDYESKQVWYTSRDGTQIPMFVVHRKDIVLDGNNPALLYGYGGFFSSQTPFFSGTYFFWLERGGVFAMANLRGGGEYGEKWHRAGMLESKQNTFDDFIAAAEWLIDNKYTRPGRLGIRGGSNGGLLVGAALVQRPDLFGAVLCGVPLLDMLRYHNFLIARYWIPEYGSADDPEQFGYLYAYSPYHNIEQGVDYPAVFLTGGESDGRVHPLHARKMTAGLQNATTGDAPILLWMERRAGHGQGKPTSMELEESADEWTFLLWQLGMLE